MITNQKSKCCDADVIIGGRGDFSDEDRVETHYFVCTKCRKACDLKVYPGLKKE